MVVALRISPPMKGRLPKLSMLEVVSVASKRYKITKLSRRINHQGFCYVCSRLDPNGIIDSSNSHLNKKGFFHTCEHFVKPPLVNFAQEVKFVQGDNEIDLIVDQISPLEKQTPSQADALSISINSHQGLNSTLNPSPLVREKIFGSNGNTYDVLDSSRSEVRLPSIYSHVPRAPHGSQLSSTRRIEAHSSQPGAHTGHSKQSWLSKRTAFSKQTVTLSEAIDLPVWEIEHSVGLPTPTVDRITIIPTGMAEEDSVITGLSTFTKGTTAHSKPSKTLFSKTTLEFKGKILDEIENGNAVLGLIRTARTLNTSGDVQSVNRVDSLVARADVMPEDTVGSHVMRPKAGRQRERISYKKHNDSPSVNVSSHRPESGRLRYHHRLGYESLPKYGFEMPPTPSILKTPSEIEHPTTTVRQFTGEKGYIRESNSSTVLQNSIASDDVPVAFSENLNLKSKVTRSGSEKSFCRCASLAREMSVSRNVCKKCGKSCLHSSVDGNDSKTEEDTYKGISRDSLSSRRKIPHPNETRVQQKSKAFTEEDYMDVGSIIHEDDRHYWSSEDDESFIDSDQFPSPRHCHKNAQNYPLVDPDIHKLAYLNALHEAQIRNIMQNKSLEFDVIQKLRRPNVFSYFSLLPYQNASINVPIKLGIRPDNSVKPKIGQLMQHIFGDVKLESFYPGRRVRDDRKSAFEHLSKPASSEPTTTEITEYETDLTVSNDIGRSSVGLKMQKLG